MITEELASTEKATEPRLPRVGYGDRCGVEGCGNNATPYVFCQVCRAPICAGHTHFDFIRGRAVVLCPACKGEEK